MSGDRGCWQSERRFRKAGAEAGVWTPVIVVRFPRAEDPPQVVLPERNQEVQALPAEAAQQRFTKRVPLGRLNPGCGGRGRPWRPRPR